METKNVFNSKFGVVVTYCGYVALAHDAEEAKAAIRSWHTYHNESSHTLVVEDGSHADKAIRAIFGEKVDSDSINMYGLKTYDIRATFCGSKGINFWPALGPTLEEHQALYEAKRKAEEDERRRKRDEREQAMLADFHEHRKGWYRVEVEITALTASARRKQFTASGYGCCSNKMQAYERFCVHDVPEMCSARALTFESVSPWDSAYTTVEFVGMKVDGGYSIAAWEEYQKQQAAQPEAE